MYTEVNPKNSVVTGKVIEVDAERALIELAIDVIAELKASDISSTQKIDDASAELNVGDEVEGKIVAIDRKNRTINFSVKAKDAQDQAEAVKRYTKGDDSFAPTTTLGDILKEKIDGGSSGE